VLDHRSRRKAPDHEHARIHHPIPAGALGIVLVACTELAAPRAQVAPPESADFFAAAVAHLAGRASAPVRVDPRPLKPEALLYSVRESDLLLTDHATIRLRTDALAAHEVPTADATADWRCVFSTGLRAPPSRDHDPIWAEMRAAESDSVRQRREACRAGGEYESLAFGLPQAGTQPDHPGRWRIRAIRMLLYGWEVVDLFLEPNAQGRWDVVAEQTRVGSFS
jgi:hypothetical protein